MNRKLTLELIRNNNTKQVKVLCDESEQNFFDESPNQQHYCVKPFGLQSMTEQVQVLMTFP